MLLLALIAAKNLHCRCLDDWHCLQHVPFEANGHLASVLQSPYIAYTLAGGGEGEGEEWEKEGGREGGRRAGEG